MPSTYSDLKIELIATGEQTGTWGATTNTNLGTALEEAITGSADVTFASNYITLTLTNTNASQAARNLRLNLIGTTGGATRNLIVPTLQKLYLINNTCTDAIVVKNSTGTGITVGAGKTNFVYNDGSNVVDAIKLGTLAEQDSDNVSITGGNITWLTNLEAASATIKSGAFTSNVPTAINGSLALLGNVCAAGQYLGSNGSSNPTWQTIPAASVVIPAGSRMLFQQTAAPTGWVKQTSSNNVALRVVSGTVGSGGTVAFTTAFASKSVAIAGNTGNKAAGGTVANHTLSNARIPSHTHSYNKPAGGSGGCGKSSTISGSSAANTGASGGSQAHNHGFTGSNHNHSFSGSSTVNVDVQYVDVIIATKS